MPHTESQVDFRADLHCHSTCSDGTMTPAEIVKHAREVGLSGLSITDHDTIRAYQQAIPAAKEEKLLLGSGVEFSTMMEGVSVHLLGYDFDLGDLGVSDLCRRHMVRRRERNLAIIEKLSERGINLEGDPLFEKIETGDSVGRPHIATALVERGVVVSVQEAFHNLIGDGKPCFVRGEFITTDETIDVIKQAGGKAFIAHPHLLQKRAHLSKLLSKPFDGIECHYSKCGPHRNGKMIKIAQEHNLLISGGSDFHGAIKPGIPLGCSWVDRDTFDRIFEKNRCTP